MTCQLDMKYSWLLPTLQSTRRPVGCGKLYNKEWSQISIESWWNISYGHHSAIESSRFSPRADAAV